MNIWFDLKYAWRLMMKTPGHSLLCIVVVALSVGMAIWSWSLAYAMAFKPMPFAGSERWYSIQIAAREAARPRPAIDAYTYQEILRRNRTINHLGAFDNRSAVLSEGQASTSLRAGLIDPGLLKAMGVAPQTGRLFDPADSRPGATPVVILSHDTWRNYFASDPKIVGREIRVDAEPARVIGVMPASFYAFEDSSIWRPLQLSPLTTPGLTPRTLYALIALEEGQTIETVAAEMKTAVDEVNRRHPTLFDAGRHAVLIPARLMFTHQNLQMVTTVVSIASAVLLLGCVNISMIFLARLLERSRELALRTAVGASRSRLLRQSLLETAYVVVFGLFLGWVLAVLGVDWMQSVSDLGSRIYATGRSDNQPELRPVDFLVAIGAATLLWLLSTLIPAWRIARQDASQVLAGGGKGVAGPGSSRSVGMLVGVQVIISSLVLVVCVNLVMTLREEGRKPTGVDATGVMISTYPTIFDARYAELSARLRYWDELTAKIKARLPGAMVAYSTTPAMRAASVPVAIEDQNRGTNESALTALVTAVSDDYFSVLGIRRQSGRLFDTTDTSTSLNVAIVDQNTIDRHWPGQNVLGKRLQLNPSENGPWLTVIGIVSNVTRPHAREVGVVYRPLRQADPTGFHLVMKVPTAAIDSRAALRAAAFAVDRDLPLHNLQTLNDYLMALNLSTISMVPAFSVIAGITVILAATGLFGLISRSVARRTQEVGVRRALGGTQWQVTAVFLRQGALYLSVAIVGSALGLLAANAITASVPNILNRAVPVTMGVLVLMALVIFTASYLPTRRAVALEPGDALRYE